MSRLSMVRALAGGGLLLVLVGCPPPPPDTDASCSTPEPLPPGATINDELNPKGGDAADCKKITAFKPARAVIEVRIGDAFSEHDLTGRIQLLSMENQVLDQKDIAPGVHKYDFAHRIDRDQPLYLKLEASKGSHGYTARLSFEKLPPCEGRCTDQQRCVDGKCVARAIPCHPPCKNTHTCDTTTGRCVSLCQPPCTGKQVCNPATRRCTTPKGCRPACKRGTRCEGGRCVKIPTGGCHPACGPGQICKRGRCRTVPKRCTPDCKPGEVCKSGRCEPVGGGSCPKCKPGQTCGKDTGFKCVDQGVLHAKITSRVRAGERTLIYLTAGRKHDVKRGMRGKACGKSFVITNVHLARSQARVSATLEELGGCDKAVIYR